MVDGGAAALPGWWCWLGASSCGWRRVTMAPGRSRRALVLLALASTVVPSLQQEGLTNPHTGLPLAPFTGEPFAQHGMQTSPNGIPPAAAWRDLGEGMKRHCFGFCGGGAGQGRGPCGDNGMYSIALCGGSAGPTEHVITLNASEAGVSSDYTAVLEAIACPVRHRSPLPAFPAWVH